MEISKEEIVKIAKLSKLSFSEAEIEKLRSELGEILTYIEQLNSVDTSDVQPLSHPNDVINVMREDVVKPSLTSEEATANAPDKNGVFFKVPKVVS